MIKEFKGEFSQLSNFEPVDIELNGLIYPSVENAYMSAKNDKLEQKIFCQGNNANVVKKESQKVQLVENQETIKFDIMYECIKQKYNQEPFKTKLIETKNEYIQEGNMQNDKIQGVCLKTNKGNNHLGKLIMKVRDELNNFNFLNL